MLTLAPPNPVRERIEGSSERRVPIPTLPFFYCRASFLSQLAGRACETDLFATAGIDVASR
jgi:hypothetical protein